jgi:hypothetical protein
MKQGAVRAGDPVIHACRDCGLAFSGLEALKNHMKSHIETGEHPLWVRLKEAVIETAHEDHVSSIFPFDETLDKASRSYLLGYYHRLKWPTVEYQPSPITDDPEGYRHGWNDADNDLETWGEETGTFINPEFRNRPAPASLPSTLVSGNRFHRFPDNPVMGQAVYSAPQSQVFIYDGSEWVVPMSLLTRGHAIQAADTMQDIINSMQTMGLLE